MESNENVKSEGGILDDSEFMTGMARSAESKVEAMTFRRLTYTSKVWELYTHHQHAHLAQHM